MAGSNFDSLFRSSQISLENKPQSSSSSIIKCALRRYYNLFIWHYAALNIDCYSAVSCRPRTVHCTLPLLRAHAHIIYRPISGKFNGFWFAGFGPNPSYCLYSSPYWAEVDLEWKLRLGNAHLETEWMRGKRAVACGRDTPSVGSDGNQLVRFHIIIWKLAIFAY